MSDNNSSDDTEDIIKQWISKSNFKIKYLFEKEQGVHYARNSAAKVATGNLLYFTDDDMVFEPDSLSRLAQLFKLNPKLGSATGTVLPIWQVPPPKWILKYCINGNLSLISRTEKILIANYDPGVYSCHQMIKKSSFRGRWF